MKPLKIIFTLLIIILLTSCVGQKQLNIDELLKKYNSITGSELESSMFTVYKSGNDFVYKRIEGSALLCLYAAKDGEITQCTVTVKSNDKTGFEPLCISVIETLTGFSANESEDFFQSPGTLKNYKLTINNYGIGKTMILNKIENELNTNSMPTLKRKVKEENIARPTLSDTDNFTKIIRQ